MKLTIALISAVAAMPMTKHEAMNMLSGLDPADTSDREQIQQILKTLVDEHKELFDKEGCLTEKVKNGDSEKTVRMCFKP